jgi:thermostable 8-oxoguanine DNA glycosylase
MAEEKQVAEEQAMVSLDEGGNEVNAEDFAEATEGEQSAEGSQPETDAPDAPAEGEKTESQEDGKDNEKVTVEGLSDAQLEQLISGLTKEGQPFHKNPAWNRIIKQRDSYKERTNSAIKRYANKDPQGALQMLLDEGYGEREAMGMLREMGVDLSAPRREKAPESGKFEDDMKYLKIFQDMGYDANAMTPEQRQFWQAVYQVSKNVASDNVKPLQEKLTKAEKEQAQRMEQEARARYEKQVNDLKKQVKDEFSIDWSEENDKVMGDYLDAHPNFRGDIDELFFLSHRDKLIDLGKMSANKEQAELNKEKEAMNSEKPGSTGTNALPPGVGQPGRMGDTFRYLRKKYAG